MVLSHKCTQKAHSVRKPQSATAARLDKSQKASHELDKQRQKREEARDHALSFCRNAIRFAISASARKQSQLHEVNSASAPMHLSQSGSRSDKRLEGRGIETRDAQRTLWSHSHGTVAQCTRKHTASESHKVPLQHGWTKPKLRTRTRASLDRTTPEEGGSPRPRAFLLSERDPLCYKCIGAEAELTS